MPHQLVRSCHFFLLFFFERKLSAINFEKIHWRRFVLIRRSLFQTFYSKGNQFFGKRLLLRFSFRFNERNIVTKDQKEAFFGKKKSFDWHRIRWFSQNHNENVSKKREKMKKKWRKSYVQRRIVYEFEAILANENHFQIVAMKSKKLLHVFFVASKSSSFFSFVEQLHFSFLSSLNSFFDSNASYAIGKKCDSYIIFIFSTYGENARNSFTSHKTISFSILFYFHPPE